jgi:translation factor GUF1, mitochondrial
VVWSIIQFQETTVFSGHYERKKKHLDNQKESKKKLKKIGTVELPQEAFFDILRSKGK